MKKIIISTCVFLSFLLVFSCKNDNAAAKSKPAKKEQQKAANKKERKNAKPAKAKANTNKNYWRGLATYAKLTDDQIAKLKDLDKQERTQLKSEESSDRRKAIRASFDQKQKNLISEKGFNKRRKYDRLWRNPLSKINLSYDLAIDKDQDAKIREITRDVNAKLSKTPLVKVNGVDARNPDQVASLLAEKERRILAVLNASQKTTYNGIKSKIDPAKLKKYKSFE